MLKCALAILGATVLLSASASAELKAGAAVRNVTPDPLLPVSGGTGPSHPATNKEGELTVRAFVLEQGGTRIAIVGADFLGFPKVLGDKARALVKGIPPENILIGVTHTHSAPDCYAFPDGQGGTTADLDYLDSVCVKMAEAINEAVGNLEPAGLKIATGEAKGKIAYNYYAPKLYDPRAHIIQAVDGNGKPIATLMNYATHPEVIGSKQGMTFARCGRPLLRPHRGKRRRHRHLHEQRSGRHGHRRLPGSRRQGHPDLGGMHPNR